MLGRTISPVVKVVVIVAIVMHQQVHQARAHDDRLVSGRVSTQASSRLMKELRDFHRSDSYKNGVFTVELVDDNIYDWHIKLFINDPSNPLHWDLQELKKNGGQDYILLHVRYNDNYPFEPPFARVAYPYLDRVAPSGALCMELLSVAGWSSAYTIEPLILSIAVDWINDSRVDMGGREPTQQYTYEEAKASFDRHVQIHVRDGEWT